MTLPATSRSLLASSYITKLISVAANFAFQIILARGLGATSFGTYAIGRAAFEIISTLCRGGLENFAIRYFPSQGSPIPRTRLLHLAIILPLILSSASAVAGLVLSTCASLTLPHFDNSVLWPLALYLPLYTLSFMAAAILRSNGFVPQSLSITNLIIPVAPPAVGLLAYALGLSSAWLLSGLTLGGAVALLYAIFWLNRRDPVVSVRITASLNDYRACLSVALPMLGISMLGILNAFADRLVLAIFLRPDQVALYAAAASLAAQVSLAMLAGNTVAAPVIAALAASGNVEQLRKEFQRFTARVVLCAAPLALFLLICSDALLNLYGPGFVSAKPALTILVLAHLINVTTGNGGAILNMTGGHHAELRATFYGLLVGLVSVALLAPHLGLLGGALASVTGVFTCNAYRLASVYRMHNMMPFSPDILLTLGLVALLWAGLQVIQPLFFSPITRVVITASVVLTSFGALGYCLPRLRWSVLHSRSITPASPRG